MVKSSRKRSRVSFSRKTLKPKKRTTRRHKKRTTRHKKRTTRHKKRTTRHKKRTTKQQKGGTLEPFTEADFGEYRHDEYMEADPEQYTPEDEGYVPDENEPTLEYKGVEYPIYININDDDHYIHLTDADGNDYMVKVSAVYREINKNNN
jgi:hypothetical protein